MTSNLPHYGQTSGLGAVMNTLVDAAIVIDAKGLIQLINPAGVKVFEYEPSEVLGQNVTLLMPEPYRSEHDDYIGRYISTGEERVIGIGREVEGRRKSGEVFPMHLAVGEMGSNGTTLFVGIIRDLTEDRRREAEYEELQARHFHLSRVAAMNEMGTAIAHEINQPLAATANYIETARILTARDKTLVEALSPVLDRALEQNHRASDIIARMRRFIERGDVASERVDLIETLEASLLLGLTKHQKSGIQIAQEIDDKARFVIADPVQIQQVLVNLIRNACEAMEGEDKQTLSVEISRDAEDETMSRVTVSDTGSGVTDESLPDLFTAFNSSKDSGLGVGLSISRSIIQANGGRIWAVNRDDSGASFTFTLPIANTQ